MKKITKQEIVDVTIKILDEQGVEGVSLKEVAGNLQIKPPSLYNHIKNREDLLAQAAYFSLENFYQALILAGVGVEKKEALFAMSQAYRKFAVAHPGQYELIQKQIYWENTEAEQISNQVVNLLQKILDGFDLPKAEQIHFIRLMRSYLHGFSSLTGKESFQLQENIEESFIYGLRIILSKLPQE
ncbi:TetR/AcrR family transcriptional regulator [Enterococcus sp. AZ072]|uniref:TetR/AcrR family transcriptional regulator n=1 Tax=unclassified Enterococcus TaxID=2608891 RepID=UPI003D2AE389